ncbi:MAG: cell envelope biogenesis protein TolA, partial [Myxococcaceae bacterium]
MAIALVVVSILLAISLAVHFLAPAPRSALSAPSPQLDRGDSDSKSARPSADAELERKKKELEEQKAQVAELKDQLKQAKRKLYEQKESEKEGGDLVKAREQVERAASAQLEIVRSELSGALAEVAKLKSEAESGRGKRSMAAPAPRPVEAAAEKPQVQKVIRELSEADKEMMHKLEAQASKDRSKASDLERELKRSRDRAESQSRQLAKLETESELVKDKFKAVEKRLNRNLLEKDMLKRALKDLEKKSGFAAERTELSADEIAASDRKVEDKQRAEREADEALSPKKVVEARSE